MTRRLEPGDAAPELDLSGPDGERISLADLRGQRVVVYFFPKAFTPGCTTEVCDFRDRQGSFAAAGLTVLGVSGDSPERLAEFRDAHQVNHDLLSDPECATAKAWGAFGPKVINGVETTGPLRSTFVIGTDGRIESADYELDPVGHVSSLLTHVGN